MARQTITKPRDFGRLHKQGASRSNIHLALRFAPRVDGGTGQRLGVVVSNKHGKAHDVNRLKRVMREAFWSSAHLLPADHDFMLIARSGLKRLDAEGGMHSVQASFRRLLPRV